MPSGNGDEGDDIGVVSDLLDEAADLTLDLEVSGLGEWGLSGVHLVHGNDELLDSKSEGKESVLAGLSVGGDTSLELSGSGGDDKDGAVSLEREKETH